LAGGDRKFRNGVVVEAADVDWCLGIPARSSSEEGKSIKFVYECDGEAFLRGSAEFGLVSMGELE
jgi:hypothetical protein